MRARIAGHPDAPFDSANDLSRAGRQRRISIELAPEMLVQLARDVADVPIGAPDVRSDQQKGDVRPAAMLRALEGANACDRHAPAGRVLPDADVQLVGD